MSIFILSRGRRGGALHDLVCLCQAAKHTSQPDSKLTSWAAEERQLTTHSSQHALEHDTYLAPVEAVDWPAPAPPVVAVRREPELG